MPLSAENQCFIDESFQLCMLVNDVITAIYHRKLDVDAICDEHRFEPIPRVLDWLKRDFDKWYPTTDRNTRIYLAAHAVTESDWQLEEVIGVVGDRVAQAYMVQHGMNPFGRMLHGMDQMPLGFETLVLPTEQDCYTDEVFETVLHSPHFHKWKPEFEAQFRRCTDVFASPIETEFFDWLRDHVYRAIEQTPGGGLIRPYLDAYDQHVRTNGVIPRRERKRRRRVLSKSAAAAGRFLGEKSVRTFISGEAILIEGQRYNYRVIKMENYPLLVQAGNPGGAHIPYKLVLETKGGEKLASLCVYFEDTPVFDQILALSLHVRDYEKELLILTKANFSQQTPAYDQDAFLNDLRPRPIAPEGLPSLPRINNEWLDLRNRIKAGVVANGMRILPRHLDVPAQTLAWMRDPAFRIVDLQRTQQFPEIPLLFGPESVST